MNCGGLFILGWVCYLFPEGRVRLIMGKLVYG